MFRARSGCGLSRARPLKSSSTMHPAHLRRTSLFNRRRRTWTIRLPSIWSRAAGPPIVVPVNGVLFNPGLPVQPGVPQAPSALGVTSVGTTQVSLSSSASAGAAVYAVERPGQLAR